MHISHAAIWVRSLERTKSFYVDVLGLEKSWESVDDEGVYNVYVRGSTNTEIQFKHDPENERSITPKTIDHIAISVDDIESIVARLEGEAKFLHRPTTRKTRRGNHARIALIEDPNGYVVELVQKL